MNKILFHIRNYLRHCVLCGDKAGRWQKAGIPEFGYKNGHICKSCLKTLYDKEEESVTAEIPEPIKELKSEFTLDDVGIPGVFLNYYSILMYILAVIVYLFPPPNTLAWDCPLGASLLVAISGPILSWVLVKDLKANTKRKLAELESKEEEKRTET